MVIAHPLLQVYLIAPQLLLWISTSHHGNRILQTNCLLYRCYLYRCWEEIIMWYARKALATAMSAEIWFICSLWLSFWWVKIAYQVYTGWMFRPTEYFFSQTSECVWCVQRKSPLLKRREIIPMFTWEVTPPCSSGAEWQTLLPVSVFLRMHR